MNRKQMGEQQASTIEQTSKGEKKRSDEVFDRERVYPIVRSHMMRHSLIVRSI